MKRNTTAKKTTTPMSDGELDSLFVDVYRKMAHNLADWENRAKNTDLQAEFQLRNRELPFKLIKEDFDRIADKLTKHLDTIQQEDPERWADMNREIQLDFQRFLDDRKKAS